MKIKKLLSSVSVILVLVMLLSMASPLTVFAAGDGITVKDLTAHIYNMEDTETLSCLFKSSINYFITNHGGNYYYYNWY